jgi:hypothetical protein
MSGYQKLLFVQGKLNAPKTQFNNFGKYKYRNCEDILKAVKPLLQEVKATIIVSDKMEVIGERYYIVATAKIKDSENGEIIEETTAYAREPLTKKGMDDSQVTGAASSYARKYALNGLLLIDDTKDSDSDNYSEKQSKNKTKKVTEAQLKRLFAISQSVNAKEEDILKFIEKKFSIKKKEDLNSKQYDELILLLQKKAGDSK